MSTQPSDVTPPAHSLHNPETNADSEYKRHDQEERIRKHRFPVLLGSLQAELQAALDQARARFESGRISLIPAQLGVARKMNFLDDSAHVGAQFDGRCSAYGRREKG